MKKILLLLICVLTNLTTYSQWVEINNDSILREVADIHFFNEDVGLVCGQIHHGVGFVLRTVDGGITWQNTVSPIVVCMSLFFLNDSVGFTGSQDMGIYKTSDGGITWNSYCPGNPFVDYDGLHFFNDSVGLLKSYDGWVYKTVDHGNTWNFTVSTHQYGNYFDNRNVNPFHFVNDSVGFVTGNGIFRTTDRGDSWIRMQADTTHYLRAITMKNLLEGYAVGNSGVILRTIDGGLNWSLDSISNQDLRDIVFINNQEGFCVGGGFDYFNDTTGIVLHTTDGGLTWDTEKVSKSRLNSIQFIDSVGYAVGNYGQIFKFSFPQIAPIDSSQLFYDSMSVYPNPFGNSLNISKTVNSKFEIQCELLDITGKICISEKFAANIPLINLDTSHLSTGIYLLRLNVENNIINRKVVKSNQQNNN